MKIELKPRFERLVQARIADGGYADESAVIEEALALLEEHHARLTTLRTSLNQARKDLVSGLCTEINDRDQLLSLFGEH